MDASGYGMAAQALGGILQSVAASQAAAAMKRQQQNEFDRQRGYSNQAFDKFQPALVGRSAENATKDIKAGADKRMAAFEQIGNTQLGIGQKPTARSKASYTLSGQNRANLSGYSDWQIGQMIKDIETQDQLNKIANFAAGDAGVFPYRLQDAQHSQDELAAFGSFLSSAGGGASNAASFFQAPPQQANYGQKQVYGMPGNSVRGGYDFNPGYYDGNFGGQV